MAPSIFSHRVSKRASAASEVIWLKTQTQKPLHTSQPKYMRTTALVLHADYKLPIAPAHFTMGPKLFVWGSSIMFGPSWNERVCLALMSQGSHLASSPSSYKFNFKGLTRKFFHSRKIEIEARRVSWSWDRSSNLIADHKLLPRSLFVVLVAENISQ